MEPILHIAGDFAKYLNVSREACGRTSDSVQAPKPQDLETSGEGAAVIRSGCNEEVDEGSRAKSCELDLYGLNQRQLADIQISRTPIAKMAAVAL